jgi:hypothetical protein
MRRRSLALALAVLNVLLSGCRDPDTERAVDAVRGLTGALEREDGRAACEHLSEAGVSELLLAAVRVGIPPSGLEEPEADRCAIVASRLAAGESDFARLRDSPVSATLLEGDRATVQTHAGSYEVEEVDGHWRVARLDPVVRLLTGGSHAERPVHLTVVRPRLSEPVLGPVVAGRSHDESIEIHGTLDPPDATLRAEASPGTGVSAVEAGDGRYRVVLDLGPGRNEALLVAEAPGRATTELVLRVERDG